MPIFRWQGVGPRGERLTGEMDAASPAVVRSRLRAERIRPLDQTIRPKRPRFGAGLSIPGLGHKVRQKDLVVFTRQFATMIDAGLPLIRGLDIVARQTDNTALQDILRQVRHDVANGTPLAEAMAKHPPRSQGRRQLRLYRGEQSQVHPLGFTLYVNNPEIVHFSYRRYLLNTIRSAFSIRRVPIRLDIRKGARRRSQ